MKTKNINDLEKIAKSVRRRIFQFKTEAGKGHLASCLSLVDVLVSLYFDQNTVFDHEEDIIIYGKGHGSPTVYPILADFGYYSEEELDKYCTPEGILRLHADASIPGCHFVGGSLGNGIGYAAGLAFGSDKNINVVLGDAELYEGSIWETLIFASHYNLNNLRIIVDRNGMGILGKTEELLRLEPLTEKFESFGYEVISVDGHDFQQLRKVFSEAPKKPQVIIANTVKGKGVSYMEDKWRYHTIIPDKKDLIDSGLAELT